MSQNANRTQPVVRRAPVATKVTPPPIATGLKAEGEQQRPAQTIESLSDQGVVESETLVANSASEERFLSQEGSVLNPAEGELVAINPSSPVPFDLGGVDPIEEILDGTQDLQGLPAEDELPETTRIIEATTTLKVETVPTVSDSKIRPQFAHVLWERGPYCTYCNCSKDKFDEGECPERTRLVGAYREQRIREAPKPMRR